ncbi:MAG: hypothetical protein RLZZ157_1527 [Pseudomonadota bacterium]|jgi:hypothetical protein
MVPIFCRKIQPPKSDTQVRAMPAFWLKLILASLFSYKAQQSVIKACSLDTKFKCID